MPALTGRAARSDPDVVRKRRVIAAVVVVVVATIAACLGPTLSSTEQEAVVVQQGSSVLIGDVMIGMTGSASITISPAAGSSSSSDTITSITRGSCPGFALQLLPLPASVIRTCGTGSGTGTATMPMTATAPETSDLQEPCTDTVYTFGVTYSPTAAGPASCTITISGSTFAPLTVSAVANGIAPAFAMDVTPKTINFGDVRVGNSGSQPLDIRNVGTSPLPINQPFMINPATGFSVTNLAVNPIGPSKTETVTVTCTPPSATAFNSTLVVSGGAGSQNVVLACRGITTNLNLTPSPADVTIRVGESVQKDITVQNLGGASSTLNSISVVPTVPNVPITIVSAPPPGSTLGPGSSAIVSMRFAPTAPQASGELAKLRINHDGNMIRDAVINGAALETTMAVFPDTVDFGPVCAGTTEMRDVSVKAGTAGGFTLTSFTMPAAPFMFRAKTGTPVPGNALPNQGNTLEFVATVMPSAGGTKAEGSVTLNTDIPGDTAHKLSLVADILPNGVGASPQSMDFGGVIKNTLSQAMSTEVRNCSDAPLVIDDVHIEGPNGTDFSIVIPGPSELLRTLQPRESVKYHVVMRSDTPGAKVGTLVIGGGTSSVQIGLVATALGGGDGDGLGERSYYTCGDCNSGGGPGVLAFVVFLGLRRRRR